MLLVYIKDLLRKATYLNTHTLTSRPQFSRKFFF